MKTLYFEPPPPCLSLILSLSLSLNRIRARKEEEFYKKSFYLGEKKVKPRGGQTHQKALSFFLSSVLFVCVHFRSRSLAVFSRGVFIHFIFQFIRIFGETHNTHNTRDITNWKTTLDTQITERDIERERYTRNTHVVVLLQLLFCFFCCVFLRANEDDVERRRTTTTSKEADDDEVDEQENGKDTSLKLRDDDEFIETRQNDDE